MAAASVISVDAAALHQNWGGVFIRKEDHRTAFKTLKTLKTRRRL